MANIYLFPEKIQIPNGTYDNETQSMRWKRSTTTYHPYSSSASLFSSVPDCSNGRCTCGADTCEEIIEYAEECAVFFGPECNWPCSEEGCYEQGKM